MCCGLEQVRPDTIHPDIMFHDVYCMVPWVQQVPRDNTCPYQPRFITIASVLLADLLWNKLLQAATGMHVWKYMAGRGDAPGALTSRVAAVGQIVELPLCGVLWGCAHAAHTFNS